MTRNPLFGKYPPWRQLLLFTGIVLASLLFSTMIGYLLSAVFYGVRSPETLSSTNFSDPSSVSLLKLFQIVSQLGLFVVPCLLFAWVTYKKPSEALALNQRPGALISLLSIIILAAGLPFINWLMEINSMLAFPESLKEVEDWMQSSEDEASLVTEFFLKTSSTGGLIVNILMIAVLPAIGEELFFRGVLQRIFGDWTRNIHVSIIISAILFSSIHMQFYGFIPRFLMGVLFGYLLYWSGSLWVPIAAHFINNLIAVIAGFLFARGISNIDFETFGSSENPWIITGSALVSAILVLIVWMVKKRNTVQGISVETKL